jgi:hypothetical protein
VPRARSFSFGVTVPKNFKEAVEAVNGVVLTVGTRLFPRYHCGARGLNMNRPLKDQERDWDRLGQ